MRIAICSLSNFTYVAEIVELADHLSKKHEVCYFLGFFCQKAITLLQQRGIRYQVLIDQPISSVPFSTTPALSRSDYDLFTGFFFKYAELVLPYLIQMLKRWKPDLIMSSLRDYAGMTAAEILNKPFISFGCYLSPHRIEGIDPPFGCGLNRDAPSSQIKLMWQLHRQFNQKLDLIYNQVIRRSYGLCDVENVSTLYSQELVLLTLITSLNNTISPIPPFIHYIGSLSYQGQKILHSNEVALAEKIALLPKPRVLLALGTTYIERVLEKCLKALSHFSGTIIVSLGGKENLRSLADLNLPNVIWSSFFFDINRIVESSDAVVTVGAGKAVMDVLRQGKPMICVPQQGEQREISLVLQSLGAAELYCPRQWDDSNFASLTEQVATTPCYHVVAGQLQSEIDNSSIELAENLLERMNR